MLRIGIVLALTLAVAACAHQTPAAVAPAPALGTARAQTGCPLVIVDGEIQSLSCGAAIAAGADAGKPPAAQRRARGCPLLIIDGAMITPPCDTTSVKAKPPTPSVDGPDSVFRDNQPNPPSGGRR
jgi:hypothetical protein